MVIDGCQSGFDRGELLWSPLALVVGKVGSYKLEGGDGWSLEVVTEDGTSIVWDELFKDDRVAFEEAVTAIRTEGAVAFANGGPNVIPFKP